MKSKANQIRIESVANGYVVRQPACGGFPYAPGETHVFTDAASLGAFVVEHFRAGEAPEPQKVAEAAPAIKREDVRALRPGDVVILSTGERSTVVETDGSSIPVRTDRRANWGETQWFYSDGRLRCPKEDGPDAPRIIRIEKKQ
jgi:hypothetical protein